jgi:HK97 family phage major capsid protein
MPTAYAEPIVSRPITLLPTNQTTDFVRNFRQLEKAAKRPYSLAKVIREKGSQPPRLTGFEMEVHQELCSLNRNYDPLGVMIPMAALSRRDVSVATYPQSVQTSVETDVIPFLRYRSVVGRLGGTLLTDLVSGPWKLPRATATGGTQWLTEIANATPNEAAFDAITLTASRISANSIVSKQLVAQAQPDIEQIIIDELNAAVATEVDRVALNGSGTAPEPLGILNLPVNASGQYNYASRSPNVTFGGPATWANILKFETTLDEGAQVHADGTFGWACGPGVRSKWMAAPKVATYPEFLWEQPDTEIDGRVAGRTAVSTSQMPAGTVIFGRWSDALIASWTGAEILVNPFARATQAEHVITLNFWVAVAFRYSSAFVCSSDSGAQ